MTDGNFIQREKGRFCHPPQPGDCFVASYQAFLISEHFFRERGVPEYFDVKRDETLRLVHGHVWNDFGFWMAHAWVESWNVVYDFSCGQNWVGPKHVYYQNVKKASCYYYTIHTALRMTMKYQTYGHWEIEETEEELAHRASLEETERRRQKKNESQK